MSKLQLLFGVPLLWGVSLTVLDTFLFLLLQRLGMRKMEAFIVALITVIGGAFVIELFLAKPDMGEVVKGFVPSIPNATALYLAIGIIGATVMPHNLYLHSALVQTRKFSATAEGLKKAIRFNFIDAAVALNLAFFVNAAILVLAASAFHENGLFEIAEIQDAHKLLENLLGSSWAPILFAVALIAAGQSSTITGTLAGQIVMEGYLQLRIQPWLRRLLTRLLAVVPAFLVILYFGEEKTGPMLIFSQVLLSLQLGFAIVPLIHLVSDRETMGAFAISLPVRIAAWVIAFVIIALNIQLVYNEVTGWLAAAGERSWILWLTVIPAIVFALAVLVYLVVKPTGKHLRVAAATAGPHSGYSDFSLRAATGYRCIVIGLDFSSSDREVLQRAVDIGGVGAKYVLVHVVESAGARLFGREVNDHEAAADRQILQQFTDRLREQGYDCTAQLEFGSPRRRIAAVANEGGADLVVLGAHGHQWFKDMIFGTTIEGVRHLVEADLVVVWAGGRISSGPAGKS